ncbi:MAG TPA: protein kinase [Polyangiaceae bacterium]|jgi:serine/threonine-protein kinase
MEHPQIPDDEAKRLALLKACKIIYTPAEEAFDEVARLAAELCGAEIALITLVDSDYQWFKARVGVDQVGTPRDLSFCGHCINHHHPLVVRDTHDDPRFADNPLVTGEPKIRFYAGVPLLVEAGSAVGALSVADRTPRSLTDKQLDSLQRLAKQIARELRLRRDLDRVATNTFPVGPGSIIAERWRIERELGRGTTGAVFEAHDLQGAHERVALKVLLPEWRANEMIVERLAREARVLMHLKTPHVGHLLEVGNLDAGRGSLPFLVLEYLEGTDLERYLQSKGPLPYREAFALAADACDGVAEAHDLGVIHRDIKPSNVFLAREGDRPPIVKVLDFGLAAGDPAAATPSQLTNVESLMGSPAYMSPEQMLEASDVDPRSDIWSMGALLYQVLTGALPFQGENYLQIFANVMTKPPLPLRSHVEAPPAVEAVILKCLRRDRTQRFQSMGALATALRGAVS